MKKIKYLLLLVSNLSPVFSVSVDNRFGGISDDEDKRYSLLRISIGLIKIYFITWKKGLGFNCFKLLKFHSLKPWPSSNQVDEKLTNYKRLIQNTNDESLKIHIQYLQEKIHQELTIKSTLQNKVIGYLTILTIIVPFLVYFISLFPQILELGISKFILFTLLFFIISNFFNCIIFISILLFQK